MGHSWLPGDEGDQLALVGLDVAARVDGQAAGGRVDRRADEERHGHGVEPAELAGGLPCLEQPLEMPGHRVVGTGPEPQGAVRAPEVDHDLGGGSDEAGMGGDEPEVGLQVTSQRLRPGRALDPGAALRSGLLVQVGDDRGQQLLLAGEWSRG
jgi:hypothetical protein